MLAPDESNFAKGLEDFDRERSRSKSKKRTCRKTTDKVKRIKSSLEEFKVSNEDEYLSEKNINNIYIGYKLRECYHEVLKTIPRPSFEEGLRVANNIEEAEDSTYTGKYSWTGELKNKMVSVFKFKEYRLKQEPAINAIMDKRDVFCCMPTSGGKSLIFQLPTLQREGFALVFMPTISLINDQVTKLNSLGIKTICTTDKSNTSKKYEKYIEVRNVLERKDTKLKFVFITPEYFFAGEDFRNLLIECYKKNLLSAVAIDEVHCVSQWGFDFRKEYRRLEELKSIFPGIQIIALTATATKLVREDCVSLLKMERPIYFESTFNRKNLRYRVITLPKPFPKQEAKEKLREVLVQYIGKCGIIYCTTIKNCEEVARSIEGWKGRVCLYHSKLSEAKRKENAEIWGKADNGIMVATIAFGMGIDKPNVRFVIHLNISKSIENYFQESGRAGRDGKLADCILFYHKDDARIQENFSHHNDTNNIVLEQAKYQLNLMVRYCEDLYNCRRKLLLIYFGHEIDPAKDCEQHCDNCLRKVRQRFLDFYDHLNILDILKEEKSGNLQVTLIQLVQILRGTDRSELYLKNEALKNVRGVMRMYKDEELELFISSMVRNGLFNTHPVFANGRKVYYTLSVDKQKLDILKTNIERGEFSKPKPQYIVAAPLSRVTNDWFPPLDGPLPYLVSHQGPNLFFPSLPQVPPLQSQGKFSRLNHAVGEIMNPKDVCLGDNPPLNPYQKELKRRIEVHLILHDKPLEFDIDWVCRNLPLNEQQHWKERGHFAPPFVYHEIRSMLELGVLVKLDDWKPFERGIQLRPERWAMLNKEKTEPTKDTSKESNPGGESAMMNELPGRANFIDIDVDFDIPQLAATQSLSLDSKIPARLRSKIPAGLNVQQPSAIKSSLVRTDLPKVVDYLPQNQPKPTIPPSFDSSIVVDEPIITSSQKKLPKLISSIDSQPTEKPLVIDYTIPGPFSNADNLGFDQSTVKRIDKDPKLAPIKLTQNEIEQIKQKGVEDSSAVQSVKLFNAGLVFNQPLRISSNDRFIPDSGILLNGGPRDRLEQRFNSNLESFRKAKAKNN